MNIQIGMIMPGLLELTPDSNMEVMDGFRSAYVNQTFSSTAFNSEGDAARTYRIGGLWLDGHKVMARIEEISNA